LNILFNKHYFYENRPFLQIITEKGLFKANMQNIEFIL